MLMPVRSRHPMPERRSVAMVGEAEPRRDGGEVGPRRDAGPPRDPGAKPDASAPPETAKPDAAAAGSNDLDIDEHNPLKR
jgi:hypothetical protein